MLLRLSLVGFSLSSLILMAAPRDCASLASQSLDHATLQSTLVQENSFQSPGAAIIKNLPPFCRVQLTLTPTSDSNIKVELWLPTENWNGKLQGVGNGGFAGAISYEGLAGALRLHYATVATDTGHQAGGEDATWALHHPEKINDFGWRGIHLMTTAAKQIINAFYGEPVHHAYFNACSDGGREALMEAQRFPEDYDGIIAGAPANYWTHLLSNAASNLKVLLATPANYIPTTKLPAIQQAAQNACDMNDGVKDGVIENPARCHFDTAVLACQGADTDSCLTPPQLQSLNKLYAGGRYFNRKSFFPGYPPGGEAAQNNWDVWIVGSAPGRSLMNAFATQFFKNMVYNNPDWEVSSFRSDQDVKAADQKTARALNSVNPDLHAFTARGGKLILYHGWDDAAIAAPNTIHYYESVRHKLGAAQASASIQLFMVPGMTHCSNGNGAYSFGQSGAGGGTPDSDIDAALVQWVEHGVKPERLTALKPDSAVSHPLCAYPNVAVYDGKGDVTSADSFRCAVDVKH